MLLKDFPYKMGELLKWTLIKVHREDSIIYECNGFAHLHWNLMDNSTYSRAVFYVQPTWIDSSIPHTVTNKVTTQFFLLIGSLFFLAICKPYYSIIC